MKKTKEHIKVILLNGKVEKKTIYMDEEGKKYVYNQRRYWEIEEFIKGHKTV